MPLRSRLALYAYNPARSVIASYGDEIEDLEFGTVAPGGFGDLKCRLRRRNARLVGPELALFANCVLTDGPSMAFQGRWDEPGISLDQNDGDLMNLSAMGAADCLKDDPTDTSYVSQTAQYIIGQEIALRAAYLPLDQDLSQLLPDHPTALLNPAYQSKSIEDNIIELSPLLGDYTWGVWNHATHRDAAGFPTWQLYWHTRDSSTVSYLAYTADEVSHEIKPSVEYSYNVVQIKYRDANSAAPASVTVSDSRLNGNGSQGSAPFPRRKLVKDLSGDKLTGAEALGLANALLAQYTNGGWKITVVLARVRDAAGNPIPLHRVRADANIALPELFPIGVQLPLAMTPNTNVFYITETRYSEVAGNEPQLTITCDSFYDTASFQIARLQYFAQLRATDTKTHALIQAGGESETGTFGLGWGSAAVTTDFLETGVNYKTMMSALPTSINLTVQSQLHGGSPFTAASQLTGFELICQPSANGIGYTRGQYTTVGN